MADTSHGLKVAAGMKLSKLIRQIGDETTEVMGLDTDTGCNRVITKFEAMARTIWKLALGYDEVTTIKDAKSGKITTRKKPVKPDMACMQMIYDRIEGKIATNADSGKKKPPLSEKVGNQTKRRLNAMAGGNDDNNCAEAPPARTLPPHSVGVD